MTSCLPRPGFFAGFFFATGFFFVASFFLGIIFFADDFFAADFFFATGFLLATFLRAGFFLAIREVYQKQPVPCHLKLRLILEDHGHVSRGVILAQK